MEWSKLKNIIILLLLLVNLFFLLLVGGQEQQRIASQEELQKGTVAFLKKNGIALAAEIVPWEAKCNVQIVERDQKQEERMARQLLKNDIVWSEEGLAIEYSGDKGTVCFYQDGKFYASLKLLHSNQNIELNDVKNHAINYLEELDIRAKVVGVYNDGEHVNVSLLQMIDEFPIYTCRIEMKYENEQLRSISGWRIMNSSTLAAEETTALNASTLLIRFMEAIKEEKEGCKEIQSITQGYIYSSGSLSYQKKLTPVWFIETDQGEYLLNCMTGMIE